MVPLNFCDTCSVKQIKHVKNELNQLFAEKQCNPNYCAICKIQLASSNHATSGLQPGTADQDSDWVPSDDDSDSDIGNKLQGDSQDEYPVVAAEIKRHYVDPSLVTKGLDERVLQLLDPSEDPAKPFRCNICQTGCAKIYNFLRHLKIKHELDYIQEKPYHCDYCEERFTCFTKMHLHLTSHKTDDNEIFTCEVCGAALKTIYGYRRHVKIIHNSERKLPCRFCGKLFRDISEITGHEKIHLEKKPYPCDLCSMSFTQPNRLKRHHMTHTGEKPYTCEICNHKMRDKDYLAKHMKIFHCGVNKYSCKRCSFQCVFKKDLVLHSRQAHNGSSGRAQQVMMIVPDGSTETPVVFQLTEADDDGSRHGTAHEEEVVTSDHHRAGPSSSDLPQETIQAITNLLQEADQTNNTVAGTSDHEEVLYQCMDCGFQSPDGAEMRTHMNVHLQDGGAPVDSSVGVNDAVTYRCEDCGFTSSNAVELYEHVLNSHQEQPGSVDEVKGQGEIQKSGDEKEVLTSKPNEVSINTEGSKQCDVCSEVFSDLTELRIHQASHISVRKATGVVFMKQGDTVRKVTSPVKIQAKCLSNQAHNVQSEVNKQSSGTSQVHVVQSEVSKPSSQSGTIQMHIPSEASTLSSQSKTDSTEKDQRTVQVPASSTVTSTPEVVSSPKQPGQRSEPVYPRSLRKSPRCNLQTNFGGGGDKTSEETNKTSEETEKRVYAALGRAVKESQALAASTRLSELVDAAESCEPMEITGTSKKTIGKAAKPDENDKGGKSSNNAKLVIHSKTAAARQEPTTSTGTEKVTEKAVMTRSVQAHQSPVSAGQTRMPVKRAASDEKGKASSAIPIKVVRASTRSATRNKTASAEADFKRMTYM